MSEEEQIPKEASETSTLEMLEASLKECQEKYLHTLADVENTRKRMQKEKQELLKYAVENVLVEFLTPLDSFEKAVTAAEKASPEVKTWAMGFEMLLAQFKQVFVQHGVCEFTSLGMHFDPHLHEAVEVLETNEVEPGLIVEEFLRGYRLGERTIRAARVKVAKAPNKS